MFCWYTPILEIFFISKKREKFIFFTNMLKQDKFLCKYFDKKFLKLKIKVNFFKAQ